MLDSYTDAIDAVYSELDTYQGSIVQPVAESLKSRLRYYEDANHIVSSDELRKIDTIIEYASNLEILEKALLEFQDLARCKLHVSVYGPSVDIRYSQFIGSVLRPDQIWAALSGKSTANRIVDMVMMPVHKSNIKKYGDPKELL